MPGPRQITGFLALVLVGLFALVAALGTPGSTQAATRSSHTISSSKTLPIMSPSLLRHMATAHARTNVAQHTSSGIHTNATITVNSTADNGPGNCTTTCTLRDAIATAASGDTIGFSVVGTITLAGTEIAIAKNLTISGPGAASLTVSGNNASRIFNIGSGTVTISGLTLANGKITSGYGGAILNGGTLTIANSTVSNNSDTDAAGFGGAISNHGTLNVTNSTFSGNTSPYSDGAINNDVSGILNVADSTFSGNSATQNGAIGNFGTTNIAASTFSGNSSPAHEILGNGLGTLNVVNSTLSGNTGPGIVANPDQTTTVQNTIVNGAGCANLGGNGFTGTNNLSDGTCPGTLGAVSGFDATLKNNGGPTQTFNLIAPSNAINAASSCSYPGAFTAAIFNAAVDQRGVTRPIGSACDIGAVEAFAFTPTSATAGTPTSLTGGTYGTAYSQAVSASGGTGSNTYTVTAGSLPGGLTLSSGGTISGTPTAVGSFTFTVTATDSSGNTGEQAYSITIDKAATSTSFASSSANPSVFGQPVTLTASVTSDATGTPTGTVSFADNGTPIACSNAGGQTLSNGQATCTTSSLSVGSHTNITATYSGDTNFLGSTTSPYTQVVNKADTTTTITTSSVNPSVFGQPVTFTAGVTVNSPGAGTPTGTVSFADNGTPIVCSNAGGQTLSGGTATCTTSSLSTGAHTNITATYSGDTNFNGSTSVAFTQTVNKADTTTTITTSSANPSVFGQPVTFTAGVAVTAPGAGTPTGTVAFYDGNPTAGGTLITCTNAGGQTLSSGTATCTTASLSVGPHQIYAVYSGDTNFNTSTSAAFAQSVGRAASTTTLQSSANPANIGQPVTYTATVSGAANSGTPTGTVTFTDTFNGSTSTLCSAVPLVNGVATCTTSYLAGAVGSHTITASYSGDTNHQPSSTTLTETVQGCSVNASLLAGNQRLGIVASSNPAAAIHHISFQSGTSSLTVDMPVVTACSAPGTANATATVSGTVRSAKGTAFAIGDSITVTVRLVNGAIGEADVTDTTTGITYRMTAPYSTQSYVHITTP